MQTPEKTAAAQEAAQPLNAPAEGNALMLLLSLLPGALVGYGFALFSAIPGIGLVAFTLLFLLLLIGAGGWSLLLWPSLLLLGRG